MIINGENFDEIKILKKWTPILDSLKIEGDKFRNFVSLCAEFHQSQYTYKPYPFCTFNGLPTEKEDIAIYERWKTAREGYEDFLPTNVKVLAKLNIENKEFELSLNNFDQIETILLINKNELDIPEDLMVGIDWISNLETALIQKLSEKINKELEIGNKLIIKKLVENISIKDKNENVEITIKSEYKII